MYGKENATAPVIVLAKCPPLKELLTISICITKCPNNTSSTFQPHVIRCRQVLYIMSYSKTLYDCISFYRKYSLHNLGYLFLQQSWVLIGLLKIHIIYICLIPFIVLNIIVTYSLFSLISVTLYSILVWTVNTLCSGLFNCQ